MEFEYDARTKAWVEQRGTDIGITVMQCEQCGLYYKPMLGHACPIEVDEKIRAAGSYIIQKHIGALIELAKGKDAKKED